MADTKPTRGYHAANTPRPFLTCRYHRDSARDNGYSAMLFNLADGEVKALRKESVLELMNTNADTKTH